MRTRGNAVWGQLENPRISNLRKTTNRQTATSKAAAHWPEETTHVYKAHTCVYTQAWEKKKDKRTDREIHREIEDFPMTML